MRTSTSQFEILVNYMEQNGDITKPSKDARGRIRSIEMWEDLKTLLNSDGLSEAKSVERWKKELHDFFNHVHLIIRPEPHCCTRYAYAILWSVPSVDVHCCRSIHAYILRRSVAPRVWSDLKNNTKKKAAKINRSALRTGGGPAYTARLSDIEQRVMQIIRPQAATGSLAVAEAGLPQRQTTVDSNRTATLPSSTSPSILADNNYTAPETGNNVFGDLWNEETLATVRDSGNRAVFSYINASTPAPQGQAQSDIATPVRGPSTEPAVVPPPTPTRTGHTPQRPRRLRRRSPSHHRSNRARPATSHMEQTAQRFAQSDEEWRNFLKQKHLQEMELKEKELACQQRWQEIAQTVVSILDRAVEKM